jgi:hypothetical protein
MPKSDLLHGSFCFARMVTAILLFCGGLPWKGISDCVFDHSLQQ